MGVIYKIRPEVKNWIIEKKRTVPSLSCRGLVSLFENEFNLKISKSSINYIIKNAGLSMPVGRRLRKRRRKAIAVVQPQLESPIETPLQLPLLTQIENAAEASVQACPEVSPEIPAPTQAQAPETPIETPKQIQPELSIEATAQVPSEILEKMLSSGIILLKAADYLIGGANYISETIKNRLRITDKNLLAKIESLIYAPLLPLSEELTQAYLKELEAIRPFAPDILRFLSGILTDVRSIKINLSDGDALYLDAQLHTIWSIPHVPYNFGSTICSIKRHINKYFYKDIAFVLFMAAGYDTPTLELLNFILSLEGQEKNINGFVLYGNKLEQLEFMPLEQQKKRFVVLALWPWQFVEYRRVKKIGEFKPFSFEAQGKNLYLADIEIELSWPNKNKSITFYGFALKTSLSEKTRLIIVSNLPRELVNVEYLLNSYLSHWPDPEEAFQDFSRKVELSTYTTDSQYFFSTESLNLKQAESSLDIKQLFDLYLKALDLYVKWHFFPLGYENKDFSTLKEEFYTLKVAYQEQKGRALATFQTPAGFPPLKALEYACRRLNEKEIATSDGKRLCFSL